jgi:hypothetical protein
MVKVLGPAMSLEASGQLGGVMVFSKWKGRAYARTLVRPHNPKTQKQTGIRAMMAFLAQQWVNLSAPEQASWELLAAATNISPFNAYIAHNIRRWRENKGPTQLNPAAEGGTAIVITLTATAGSLSIDLTVDPSAATNLWGIAIFRHSVTGLDKTYNRLIKVVEPDGTNTVSWTDSPLDPGTYFYTAAAIIDDGSIGAKSAEATAAAT